MTTEDQLEQLAFQWFQATGWNYLNGTVIAPDGGAPEREHFRAVVLKGRLAEAVAGLNPRLPLEVVHPALVRHGQAILNSRSTI